MAKQSVYKWAAFAGIVLILAAVYYVWICPCSKIPPAERPATGAAPTSAPSNVTQYPQGSQPDIPAELPPAPALTKEQQAALEQNTQKSSAVSEELQKAEFALHTAQYTARRDHPERQALAAEIKATQEKAAQRLIALPGRAEKQKALAEATAHLQEVNDALAAEAKSAEALATVTNAPAVRPPSHMPDKRLTEAQEAAAQAGKNLNAFMMNARKNDLEYLGLVQRTKALREQLDASVAQDPAVKEAQARVDEVIVRMSELNKEREQILKPAVESNAKPGTSK